MIIKSIMAGIYSANCYVVFDEKTKEAVVLDPGGDEEKIARLIKDLGLKVKYIILTHAHYDHTTGVEGLKNLVGGKVAMGKADNDFVLQGIHSYGPLPKGGAEIILNDGDTLKFGEYTITVLSTPGHTVGGVCLLVDDHVFTGDTLFAGSIGRTDFPGGDYNTIINSIKSKLMCLPATVAVHPGHGSSSTIGREKLMNPFMR